MTCDPDKFKSETIYWDDMNYKAYHPDTISYSIKTESLPGKKIVWDTNQSYTIEHIDNYSYSINYNYPTCGTYTIYRKGWEYVSGSPTSEKVYNNYNWFRDFSGVNNPVSVTWETRPSQNSSHGIDYRIIYTFKNWNCTESITVTDNWSMRGYIVWDCHWDWIALDNSYQEPPKKLIINDGGNIHEYSISDSSSVQVQDIPGQEIKKITVNGNEFILNDENSIEVLCTDPVPQCPKGTIECDCGDIIWCLEKTKTGYKVVQCINP